MIVGVTADLPQMPATEHGLLGRESELAALDRLIGAAAGGCGGVVALRGEPGIGKTRLAREALSRCGRRGFELLVAAAEAAIASASVKR